MDKAIIQEQLHTIAKQNIPDSLNLWPSIQKSLKPQQKEKTSARKLITRGLLISLVLVSLMAVSIKTIAPVRVFSMGVLQRFSRAVKDSLDIEFTIIDPIIMLIANESDFYAQDIEEASSRVGFDVLAPETLPDGYYLDTILAFEGSPYVSIWYKNSNGPGSIYVTEYPPEIASEFVTVCANVETTLQSTVDDEGNVAQGEPEVISESESTDCDDLASIGPNAEIQNIHIGGVIVEYVQGDWVIPRDQHEQGNGKPGETRTYTFVWDPDHPKHRFRWESDSLAIDIDAFDMHLTLEDYIIIIESMF